MSQLLPYQPSLASATNTRVDSACKHIQQCRVSTDDLLQYTLPNRNDHEALQIEKYRYCVHKDECVVGIGRAWTPDYTRKRTNNAYPRVISNLGCLDGQNADSKAATEMIKFMYHYARSVGERKAIIDFYKRMDHHAGQVENENGVAAHAVGADNEAFKVSPTDATKVALPLQRWLPIMCDYVPVGFSNTLGWAHPNSGDTMTSVMIGGLRTVMNGDFEVFAGDEIQWYWPFEKNCFNEDGRRKAYLGVWTRVPGGHLLPPNVDPCLERHGGGERSGRLTLPDDAANREVYHRRQFGQPEGKQKIVARVKPYFRDDDNPRIYDSYRVFAVAIASARPHEMLDLKISRQSM